MDFSRRDAAIRLTTLLGLTMVGPRLAEASFDPAQTGAFTAADIALLDEIGETIIPATDIPGAKAAGIGRFLAMMISDCYTPVEQQVIRDGLARLATGFTARFGGSFVAGSPANRTAYLTDLDREQKAVQQNLAAGALPHYFRILKELTILGYFSSEIGATQALRYAEVPGSYDGNAPYTRGQRAWFN